MRHSRIVLVAALAVAAFTAALFFAAPAGAAGKAKEGKGSAVLADLQDAYNGESNAHARYLAFARKAQDEGYLKVANLFRAAARSEEVHAANHAKVIKKLGGTPEAKIETPKVASTKKNLEAAIKGENNEASKMYPDMIARAEAAKNKGAVRTFTYARDVEANHAKLFTAAHDNLKAWKVAGDPFSVCGECGNAVEKVDFRKCPVCGEPKSRYSVVK